MTNIPEDLKYTEDDEWIRIEGDVATIGITDYAQEQLSDIVYVEIPEVGDTVEKGDVLGVIESVKAAGDMHAPAGGEIVAANEALEDEPEVINSAPYGKGWYAKIKLDDPGELSGLMDAAAYKAHVEARA
jgi:glycine cleavage system H protein